MAPIGAGGMGEVYRARDPRLGRDVALKVLQADRATAEQVLRLEREARAAGALNHPNILVVFDVGTADGRPYVVSELLEGTNLRSRILDGPMPLRKALEVAIQTAEGLAAAHEKGICHRDLKPENVFLTGDGRVKILDFGLAKVINRPAGENAPTVEHTELQTGSGVVLGTTAYMSPEQVRGEVADHRSDIFAFGTVLHEMVSGRHPFRRATSVETLHAILNEEPAEIYAESGVGLAVAHIVGRCLEKRPDDRFQSTRDLAFSLRELQSSGSTSRPRTLATSPAASSVWRKRALAAGLAALALGGAAVAGRRMATTEPPRFRQLTFHRGTISTARFGPDGRSILYSASWEGRPFDVYLGLTESPESRPLGLSGVRLLAVSREGELALLLHPRHTGAERFPGTLARVPLAGGAPRKLAEGVEDADWGPGADDLAIVRSSGAGSVSRLERPIGRVLYSTSGSVRDPRIRPQGDLVAFLDDPSGFGFGGSVAVVDGAGQKRILTGRWSNARGLAWSQDGQEVWFTAAEEGAARALRAVTLGGRMRLVARAPESLTLHDIAPDGRALATTDAERRGVLASPPGAGAEREMSWFDRAGLADLSADGRMLLFGDRMGIYIRQTDGSPAVRLGGGFANSLSPDGEWAVVTSEDGGRIVLLPTGTGQAREVAPAGLPSLEAAWLLPDGQTLIINGHAEGQPLRAYRQPLSGGPPAPITPPGSWSAGLGADARFVAAVSTEGPLRLFPVEGGEGRVIPGSEPADRPAGWSADGRSLWVFRRGELPVRVDRIEVVTGARTLWRTLQPPDPAGVVFVSLVRVTPDGSAYAYSYRRVLSDMFLIDGLR